MSWNEEKEEEPRRQRKENRNDANRSRGSKKIKADGVQIKEAPRQRRDHANEARSDLLGDEMEEMEETPLHHHHPHPSRRGHQL